MTEQRACEIMERTVINGSPHVNTAEYLEALEISIDKLGVNYTREQLKNWILVNKYPFLIPKYWNKDIMSYEVRKDYDYTWTELDAMPDGWRKAFGEMMCEEIKEELIKHNCLDEYLILDIKEKFGQLRWYDNGTPIRCNVSQIIDKYSVLSENICVVCGKPDAASSRAWDLSDFSQRHTKKDIDAFKAEHEKEWEEDYAEDSKMQDSYTVHKWSKENGDEEVTYDISETANKIRAKWRIEHGE